VNRRGDDDATLRARQLWFAGAVMRPETEPPSVGNREAEQWLTAGPQMTATERLEIYRRGFHARLVECLADDYPGVRHALGGDAFDRLCRAYIARYPSDGPNLNPFGRRMAAFVREEAPQPLRALAADLASLEWAIVEVIHARSAPQLTVEALGDLSAEQWPDVRFAANPAVRLLRFEYPVNAYLRAVRDSQGPSIPAASPSATVVYRNGPTIWRTDLTAPMFQVLSALLAGERLADALACAEESLAHLPESEASECVRAWFAEWVGSGLFVRRCTNPR
jgi:hypothetical protein